MAWIKVELSLPDKPEVCQIASILDLDIDAVTGKLIRIWGWASRSCHGDGVTSVTVMSHLDRIAGVTGFVAALVKVGWCRVENDKLLFVNFDRHNSQTAKDRALAAARKARQRVTEMSRSDRDNSVTREEKIRIVPVSNDTGTRRARARFVPPTVEEVRDYCRTQGYGIDPEAFCAYYESNGWRVGRSPMRDWKAACRTWQARHTEQARAPAANLDQSRIARGRTAEDYASVCFRGDEEVNL